MLFWLAALLLAGLLGYLERRFRPTRFGFVFGLFLLYVPLHRRMPLDVLPMVNALTGFVVALVVLLPEDRPPLLRGAGRLPLCVLLYAAMSVVGLALSPRLFWNGDAVLVDFKRWLDPMVFGLLGLAVVREEDRRFMAVSATLGYLLVALHAVREGFDYGPLKRIPGLLGQPNETAAFLAIYAPLALGVGLGLLRGLPRLAVLGGVPLAGWALVFTESRGAFLAYPLTIVLALALTRHKTLAGVAAATVLLVWIFPDALPERVATRFESTVLDDVSDVPFEDTLEASAAHRVTNWKAALAAMASQPLGLGFGAFKDRIGAYGGVPGLDAHNLFLLVGAEFGPLGVVIVATLFATMLTGAWKARRAPEPFTRTLGSAVFATVAGAVVVNLFGSRLMQDQPSTYLWVLTAITARAAGLHASTARAPVPGAARASAR